MFFHFFSFFPLPGPSKNISFSFKKSSLKKHEFGVREEKEKRKKKKEKRKKKKEKRKKKKEKRKKKKEKRKKKKEKRKKKKEKEKEKKQKVERADRNKSPSTIARTGRFCYSRAWKPSLRLR